MSRKHFRKIAELIYDATDFNDRVSGADLAYNLAAYFEEEFPKFKRSRFLAACGVAADEDISDES